MQSWPPPKSSLQVDRGLTRKVCSSQSVDVSSLLPWKISHQARRKSREGNVTRRMETGLPACAHALGSSNSPSTFSTHVAVGGPDVNRHGRPHPLNHHPKQLGRLYLFAHESWSEFRPPSAVEVELIRGCLQHLPESRVFGNRKGLNGQFHPVEEIIEHALIQGGPAKLRQRARDRKRMFQFDSHHRAHVCLGPVSYVAAAIALAKKYTRYLPHSRSHISTRCHRSWCRLILDIFNGTTGHERI